MAKPRNLLLTPGPIPVPEAIRKVMAEPIIHHRTPQYRHVFGEISERIKKLFRTKNPVYTLTGSGTLAMEASIVNFHSLGDELLVVEGGKFGERFTEIAKANGLKPTVLEVTWGEGVSAERVEQELKKNPKLKSVCVELCETSTAALFDIQAIVKVVAKTPALLIVDAISGLGADRLETDDWSVDLVIAGSQKAMMLPPGLAFLSVSQKATAKIAGANLPRYYADIRLYQKGLRDLDSPFTPAITLVLGLEKALEMIETEGIENVWKRAAALGEFTRKGLQKMGLKLYSNAPSSTVSAALLPEGLDGEKLIKIMRDDKGCSMAPGQGQLKGKIVRIAHMGPITQQELKEGLGVLEETLQEMKVRA